MSHLTRPLGRWSAGLLLAATASTLPAQNNAQATQPDENRSVKANWSLANRFSTTALRGITYTFGVQPRFLGQSDTMYYNWRDRNGNRFMLYVPSPTGGSKRLLFDPAKMAEQLTLISRKPYDATNLPFQTITFLKNHKGFRFTVDTVRYEWTLATETLTSLGRLPRNAPSAADEERDTQGGGGEAVVAVASAVALAATSRTTIPTAARLSSRATTICTSSRSASPTPSGSAPTAWSTTASASATPPKTVVS